MSDFTSVIIFLVLSSTSAWHLRIAALNFSSFLCEALSDMPSEDVDAPDSDTGDDGVDNGRCVDVFDSS